MGECYAQYFQTIRPLPRHIMTSDNPLQVNIHDAAFLKVSLKGDSTAFRDWRPWSAQTYVPVRQYGAWYKGLAIALLVLVVLAFVILLGIVLKQNCVGRSSRRFGRLEENGVKAKRSPSGRLSSGTLDNVA